MSEFADARDCGIWTAVVLSHTKVADIGDTHTLLPTQSS